MDAELPNGKFQRSRVLVDTGAELNLVRPGFISEHLLIRAETPMVFLMDDGSRLPGGSHTVESKFQFVKEMEKKVSRQTFCSQWHFYRADIQVDIILGHPWMVEERVGIFPHLAALALAVPP